MEYRRIGPKDRRTTSRARLHVVAPLAPEPGPAPFPIPIPQLSGRIALKPLARVLPFKR
jgi:hypothetical protein